MATTFGGHSGELCQDFGIYRSDFGQCRPIEEGKYFPDGGGFWSRVGNFPDAQAMAGEQAQTTVLGSLCVTGWKSMA